MRATTRNVRIIRASRKALYAAFTDPAAMAVWLAPGDMTGEVHSFDLRVGGGYRMSLFYPPSEEVFRGKNVRAGGPVHRALRGADAAREDRPGDHVRRRIRPSRGR